MALEDAHHLLRGRGVRRPPAVGDLLELNLRIGGQLLARVVGVDIAVGPFDGMVLLYVYRPGVTSDVLLMAVGPPAALLLLPPVIVNRSLWRAGFVRVLGNEPITDEQRLPRHQFRWFNKVFNEHGEEVEGDSSLLMGDWSVSSAVGVDQSIGRALSLR